MQIGLIDLYAFRARASIGKTGKTEKNDTYDEGTSLHTAPDNIHYIKHSQPLTLHQFTSNLLILNKLDSVWSDDITPVGYTPRIA